jgi:uncharacterized protein YlaI
MVCGPTSIRKYRVSAITGEQEWLCTGKLNNRHRIFEVDSEAKTGYCTRCRSRVRVNNVKSGANKGRWVCLPGKRSHHLKAMFGLTPEEYDKLFASQDNRCAICGRERLPDEDNFPVDHTHYNGKIRGIICPTCNHGLGNFYDNPELLRKAANYIEAHRFTPSPILL